MRYRWCNIRCDPWSYEASPNGSNKVQLSSAAVRHLIIGPGNHALDPQPCRSREVAFAFILDVIYFRCMLVGTSDAKEDVGFYLHEPPPWNSDAKTNRAYILPNVLLRGV